jgi:hypothetical protein
MPFKEHRDRKINPTSQFGRGSSLKSFGSLAMFTAILRASSLLSDLAADRRPGFSELNVQAAVDHF